MTEEAGNKSVEQLLGEALLRQLHTDGEFHKEKLEYLLSEEGERILRVLALMVGLWFPKMRDFGYGVTRHRNRRALILASLANVMDRVVPENEVDLLATRFSGLLRAIEEKGTICLGTLARPVMSWVNYEDPTWQNLQRRNVVVPDGVYTKLLRVLGRGERTVMFHRLSCPVPVDGAELMEEVERQRRRTLDLAEMGTYQRDHPYPHATGRTILLLDFQGCDDAFVFMTYAELKGKGQLVLGECQFDFVWPSGTEFIVVE